MTNRLLTLLLVVLIGILAGVGIVLKKSSEPLLKEMLRKQGDIVTAQGRIEQKLSMGAGAGASGPVTQVQVAALEMRIAAMENQLKGLKAAAQQVQRPAEPPQEDTTTVYTIDVGASPVFGKKDAPVTLVEFVDFQCPFCARFHEPLFQAAKAYPDKVNMIIKNFPLSFHPQARPGAKAALAAIEQGKYFEMADVLLQNGNSLSEDKFKQLAKDLGLNVDKFMKDYKDQDAKWEQMIQADLQLGQKVGVRGTPTFYINGHKTFARDVESIKQEIEKELAEKK